MSTCHCSHVKKQHTRGEGQCWSAVCGCREFRHDPVADAKKRHPAGNAIQ
jgi:hypothetical protein